MSAPPQAGNDVGAPALLDQQPVRLDLARIEGLGEMPAGEQRPIDRGLQVEPMGR
jgi:hypothetical protein